MSKSELFKGLETLNRDELEDAAQRIAELLQVTVPAEELTVTERTILEERIAREKANPGRGERWEVVRDRVLAK